MTVRRRGTLTALAVAGVGIVLIGIAAEVFLVPWLRGEVERIASRALGRELKIAGAFTVSFSLTPRVTAADVRLANAPWGSEPSMLRAGRVAVALDLVSLLSEHPRLREVKIEAAHVVLEEDGRGRGNWVLAPEPPASEPSQARKRPQLVLERVVVRGLELVTRSAPGAKPTTVALRELDAWLDPTTRMIHLDGNGRFNETPWELSGWLGTLERVYQGRNVEHSLTARIGGLQLESRGMVRDLLSLGAPDIEVSAASSDIVAALKVFGLSSPATGAFHLRGRLTPGNDGVDAEIDASLGEVRARVRGALDAQLSLETFDVAVEAAGPEASEVGSWIGVPGLPSRPFNLAAALRRRHGELRLERAALRVGPTSLDATGVLGLPPRFIGTDLEVRGSGQDLAELSRLTHLPVPRGQFLVTGRFLRRADGLAIDAAELRFAGAVIHADGTIGEPPRLANLELRADASGSDLGAFSRLVGTRLPQAPFSLRGRVTRAGDALILDAVEGRLGDSAVSASGRVVPVKRLEGTEVEARVAGRDLEALALLLGVRGVPAQPFEARGRVRVVPGGLQLDGVEASVGGVAVAADGRIAGSAGRDGTSLMCRAHGAALSDLTAWGLPEGLPAEEFSLEGRLRIADGLCHVDGLEARVGPDRVAVDGALGALPDLSRLDVRVEAAGPSLAGLERFLAAAGVAVPRRLPSAAYEVSGRVRLAPEGYELHEVLARVGETLVRVEGTLGSGTDRPGTNLRFWAGAPDTSLLSELAAARLPGEEFELDGCLADLPSGLLLDGVSLAVGEVRVRAAGTLGPWPELEGSELEVVASGPDLAAALGPVAASTHLPAVRFELAANLAGSARRVAATRLTAQLGSSDIEGRVALDVAGRPALDADLRSTRLDVAELLASMEGRATPSVAEPTRRGRVIPDDPLELGALRTVDVTLKLEAATMALPWLTLREVSVLGALRGGALDVERFEGTGPHGCQARAGLALEPSASGYRFAARGRIDRVRLMSSQTGRAPERAPSLDIEFQLGGEGPSLHDIAATLNGDALAVVGSGEISSVPEFLTSGVLASLLDALNPFRRSSDHTDFECGVALATVADGKVSLDPVVLRTNRTTVVGHGKVDLGTEAIDLHWTIKPRTGVGLTPSSIANPYVKLGGTLSSPSLDVKPLEAVASTGAAVATVGLTVLAKGLYDRITAEKSVCVDALVKSESVVPGQR